MTDKNLFYIDFESHPSYEDIKPNLFSRLFYNSIAFFIFLTSSISIFLLGKYPKKVIQNIPLKVNSFFKYGVISTRNDDFSRKLKVLLSGKIKTIEDKLKEIPIEERKISDCINSIKKSNNLDLYTKIEEEALKIEELEEILSLFFHKKNVQLVNFNIHINQENDKYVFKHDENDTFDDEMNFFHLDTNLNTVKVMVYLTDVYSEECGGFEYVLKSNRLFNFKHFLIRKVVRLIGAYRRDFSGKKKMLSLLSPLRMSNDLSDFNKDSQLGGYINKNKKLFLSKNNIIIFDPLGIHRGGRVKKGKRTAVQLVFCVDNYSWRII